MFWECRLLAERTSVKIDRHCHKEEREPFWNYPKRVLARYAIKKAIALLASALICIHLRLKKIDRRFF